MGLNALAFSDWATTEGVATSGSIDQIQGKRLAIDAESFLDVLLTSQATREPLLPALGGLPFALKKHVDAHLSNFEEANITPTFIFNGMDYACKDRNSVARESRAAAQSLNEAWSLYSQSKADDAVAEFGKSCTYRTDHILKWLHCHLAHREVRTQTAPYSAAAQAVSLDGENFSDAVVGSLPCLFFGASKVIINVDWENRTFVWVEKVKCMSKLALSEDQFADLCLLSGLTILPPPPEVEDSPLPIQSARSLLARAGNYGLAACDQLKNDEYTTLFKKARTVLAHKPILAGSGQVQLQGKETASADTHDVIGQRLPSEMLYYMSRGVVGPRMLAWRTNMEIYECPPLDGGSSSVYQQLVSQKLVPLRTRALALMTHSLARYYQNKDVDLVCWFNESNKRALGVPDVSRPADAGRRWRVKDNVFVETNETTHIDIRQTPLLFAVTLLSNDAVAKKTVTEESENAKTVLTGTKELVSNAVLRFLEDRGYINNNHTLSAWGKALKASLDKAKENGYMQAVRSSAEAEEAIFMAFELHRLDVLSTNQMFPASTYLGAPMRGSDTDKAFTLLLSRIATLGTFRHREIGFTGPLSRHLLAYQQMTAAVRGSLRDLVEVHALSMLVSNTASRGLSPEDLTAFGCNLPFVREPDLGLSLVVKSYLDELSNEPSKRADITRWFNHAEDIPGDLQKAWKMWEAINAGIQAADSAIVNNDTKTTFKQADEWLQQKLLQASAPAVNGQS